MRQIPALFVPANVNQKSGHFSPNPTQKNIRNRAIPVFHPQLGPIFNWGRPESKRKKNRNKEGVKDDGEFLKRVAPAQWHFFLR